MTLVVFLQVVSLAMRFDTASLLVRSPCTLPVCLGFDVRGCSGPEKAGTFRIRCLFQNDPSLTEGHYLVTLLTHLLIGIVVFVILVKGIVLVLKTISQESPAMGISMSWAYACLPVG